MVAYETVEQTLDRRADEAWSSLLRDPDWNRWRIIGEALLSARQRCMKLTRSKRPFGRGYTEAFKAWLAERTFKSLSANDRAALLTCMERLVEIETWRAGLSEDLRVRYNHPRTVLKHFIDSLDNVEAAHSYTVLDDADPEFPALTDLEIDESKMAEVEDEDEADVPTPAAAAAAPTARVRTPATPTAKPSPRPERKLGLGVLKGKKPKDEEEYAAEIIGREMLERFSDEDIRWLVEKYPLKTFDAAMDWLTRIVAFADEMPKKSSGADARSSQEEMTELARRL